MERTMHRGKVISWECKDGSTYENYQCDNTHHINQMKNENDKIVSVDIEKTFDKFKTSLWYILSTN